MIGDGRAFSGDFDVEFLGVGYDGGWGGEHGVGRVGAEGCKSKAVLSSLARDAVKSRLFMHLWVFHELLLPL